MGKHLRSCPVMGTKEVKVRDSENDGYADVEGDDNEEEFTALDNRNNIPI